MENDTCTNDDVKVGWLGMVGYWEFLYKLVFWACLGDLPLDVHCILGKKVAVKIVNREKLSESVLIKVSASTCTCRYLWLL